MQNIILCRCSYRRIFEFMNQSKLLSHSQTWNFNPSGTTHCQLQFKLFQLSTNSDTKTKENKRRQRHSRYGWKFRPAARSLCVSSFTLIFTLVITRIEPYFGFWCRKYGKIIIIVSHNETKIICSLSIPWSTRVSSHKARNSRAVMK